MPDYRYLVVGGGMTAASAVAGIREVDPGGSIGLVGSEPRLPYDRPPLSKGLWKDGRLDAIWRRMPEDGVTLHLGRTARHLDPDARRVVDDLGTVYGYDQLLLATGGTPRRLPFADDGVIYFRTLDDYERLRAEADRGSRFVVIGGGFIGSEIAAALASNSKAVTMVFPGEAIGSALFPRDLARSLDELYVRKGVDVRPGMAAVGLEQRSGQRVVRLRDPRTLDEREIAADGVVAGIGTEPNVGLALEAGIEVDDGILVDASLRTSRADVFAAGDVARFPAAAFGRRLRVEHEDAANTMGRLAGQAMAGADVRYDHLPFFYSDLFDLGYEAVGELDSRLETVSDWKEPFREGVVYYLREGRVRGVLLWNVWGQVDAARRLIAQPGPFHAANLRGRLPE